MGIVEAITVTAQSMMEFQELRLLDWEVSESKYTESWQDATCQGLPWWSSGKESAFQCRQGTQV